MTSKYSESQARPRNTRSGSWPPVTATYPSDRRGGPNSPLCTRHQASRTAGPGCHGQQRGHLVLVVPLGRLLLELVVVGVLEAELVAAGEAGVVVQSCSSRPGWRTPARRRARSSTRPPRRGGRGRTRGSRRRGVPRRAGRSRARPAAPRPRRRARSACPASWPTPATAAATAAAALPAAAAAASDRTVPRGGLRARSRPIPGTASVRLLPVGCRCPVGPAPGGRAGPRRGAEPGRLGGGLRPAEHGEPLPGGRLDGDPVAGGRGGAGSAVSSDGTRRCSSSGARSRRRSSSGHQSRPPGAARVRVAGSAAATPGTGRPRCGGPGPARPTRSSSPGRAPAAWPAPRSGTSRTGCPTAGRTRGSPSSPARGRAGARRMNDWAAVMASSIRLARSRRPASTSSSSRSLRSPGAVANCARLPGQRDAVLLAQVGDERAPAALAQPVVEPPAGPRSGAGSPFSRQPPVTNASRLALPVWVSPGSAALGSSRGPQVRPRRRRCPGRRTGPACARSQRSACQARSAHRSSARSALVTSYTGGVLALEVAQVERPVPGVRAQVPQQVAGMGGLLLLRLVEQEPQRPPAAAAHVRAGRGVVEQPLPPVEHRLDALRRRSGARVRARRGGMVVVAQRQEVEVEVRGVPGEPAVAAVVARPGEQLRLGEQVAELGGSVRLAPRRQPEPVAEQQRLERPLVGPADVAQRAGVHGRPGTPPRPG